MLSLKTAVVSGDNDKNNSYFLSWHLYISNTKSSFFQTNARFLSDHSNPTTATLVTPDDAATPSVGVEAAADTENHANDEVKVIII